MNVSTAIVTTEHASKYLQQLCKHFGHKVPVEFTSEEGHVSLPFGSCQLRASADALTLQATGGSGDIGRLEAFLGSHLERFAFRENPEINWRRVAS